MQLHEFRSRTKKKVQKRIGRGGKRGTFSGRGTKGQRSRSGRRIRKAERDLIIRLPKRRGFRNKPVSPKAISINLRDLNRKLKPLANSLGKSALSVDRTVLSQVGLIGKRENRPVKVLSNGQIDFPISLKGVLASKAAIDKIKKVGGSAEA